MSLIIKLNKLEKMFDEAEEFAAEIGKEYDLWQMFLDKEIAENEVAAECNYKFTHFYDSLKEIRNEGDLVKWRYEGNGEVIITTYDRVSGGGQGHDCVINVNESVEEFKLRRIGVITVVLQARKKKSLEKKKELVKTLEKEISEQVDNELFGD